MAEDVLIRNWPILAFLLFQVVGSWKILSNIKDVSTENKGDFKVVKTQLQALEDRIIRQNSRIGKLEDKHEEVKSILDRHIGSTNDG